MVSRRSFFSRVAAFVAVIALAPEIAFGRKLEMPSVGFPDVPGLTSIPIWLRSTEEWQHYTVKCKAWRLAVMREIVDKIP